MADHNSSQEAATMFTKFFAWLFSALFGWWITSRAAFEKRFLTVEKYLVDRRIDRKADAERWASFEQRQDTQEGLVRGIYNHLLGADVVPPSVSHRVAPQDTEDGPVKS